ncbi:MAG: dephospho-CoA kinase [Haliangiales bacterium]
MARIIGLTGGIASGKSTVATMLRALGADIVDADLVAREVVAPGSPALAELRAHFGDDIIGADGGLDRKALGARVFGDEDARQALNRITHPRIAQASQQKIAALAAGGADPIIYEAALIVENRLYPAMQGLIVVSVPEAMQIERLMARDDIDRAAAEARVRAQLALADKVAVASHVIDNSRSRADTEAQVEALWRELSAAPSEAPEPAETTS